ncbi:MULTISPECIES: metal-dependent hydrolase [unclassified Novosphingobium]|uniref:metal-dependent hydrolase n=1 Tax=unclassified Novosphingobium TaxID=2644732 RepID=UPI0025D1C5F5|nr:MULTISPECIES: metal-dependent hydrolase [unclassified Novosphingobium]HQV02987.1 metal-dependent hydrolase [Novosphingobium sp.]
MDNLTHSLIGAALGQAGLKRKTGLAMPALIIAANLPDIDAGCVVYGIESLAMRRGISHGPIALVLLPLLLAGVLWWFDHWQAGRGKRPEGRLPVDFKWLLALCYIGTLSHPLFDWFNNYGIRLLEPFSHQWFYGDTLFIIDLWILIALGIGLWRSLRRERAGQTNWAAPAQIALAVMASYVGINMVISRTAEETVRRLEPDAEMVVANAVPIAFWRRDVLWRSDDGFYGTISCNLNACLRYPRVIRKTNWPDPRVAAWAKDDPAAQAFLFWSRMPLAQPGPKGILLKDQRFADSPARDNFTYLLNPR